MFLLRFQINYDYDNSHSKRDKRVIFGGGIVQTVLEAQLKSQYDQTWFGGVATSETKKKQ